MCPILKQMKKSLKHKTFIAIRFAERFIVGVCEFIGNIMDQSGIWIIHFMYWVIIFCIYCRSEQINHFLAKIPFLPEQKLCPPQASLAEIFTIFVLVTAFYLICYAIYKLPLTYYWLDYYEYSTSWKNSLKKDPVTFYERCATCKFRQKDQCALTGKEVKYFDYCDKYAADLRKSMDYYYDFAEAAGTYDWDKEYLQGKREWKNIKKEQINEKEDEMH